MWAARFSSSATVYGMPEQTPIAETDAIQPINPYGRSKVAVEQLLADMQASAGLSDGAGWRLARLRYFNPVGAHPTPADGSVRIRCSPRWPTADGSGERDFIHVMDLADGHLTALNLGSGQGHPDPCGGAA